MTNPADVFRLYCFQRDELRKSSSVQVHSEVSPFKSITGAPFTANTMLRLLEVDEITLKQLGNSDIVARTLTDAFAHKLRTRNIELRVSYKDFKGKNHDFLVKPPQFRGSEMDVEKLETEFGEIEFCFYHTPRPMQSPNILVQHKGVYSLPLTNFFKLKVIGKAVEDLFARGYFEGVIKLGFCELDAARACFRNDVHLKVFVQAVESFAETILRPIVTQLDQEGREERHKRIADGLLKKVRNYFERHPHHLPPTIKSFILKPKGSEEKGFAVPGSGNSDKTKKKEAATRPKLAKDAFKKQRQRNAEASASGNPSKKKEPRVMVLDEGLGLQMVYPDADEGFAWHSRTYTGLIQINTANNDFLDAERRGQTKLSEYMFLLLKKELTCSSLPPINAQIFGDAFEKSFMPLWRASLD